MSIDNRERPRLGVLMFGLQDPFGEMDQHKRNRPESRSIEQISNLPIFELVIVHRQAGGAADFAIKVKSLTTIGNDTREVRQRMNRLPVICGLLRFVN